MDSVVKLVFWEVFMKASQLITLAALSTNQALSNRVRKELLSDRYFDDICQIAGSEEAVLARRILAIEVLGEVSGGKDCLLGLFKDSSNSVVASAAARCLVSAIDKDDVQAVLFSALDWTRYDMMMPHSEVFECKELDSGWRQEKLHQISAWAVYALAHHREAFSALLNWSLERPGSGSESFCAGYVLGLGLAKAYQDLPAARQQRIFQFAEMCASHSSPVRKYVAATIFGAALKTATSTDTAILQSLFGGAISDIRGLLGPLRGSVQEAREWDRGNLRQVIWNVGDYLRDIILKMVNEIMFGQVISEVSNDNYQRIKAVKDEHQTLLIQMRNAASGLVHAVEQSERNYFSDLARFEAVQHIERVVNDPNLSLQNYISFNGSAAVLKNYDFDLRVRILEQVTRALACYWVTEPSPVKALPGADLFSVRSRTDEFFELLNSNQGLVVLLAELKKVTRATVSNEGRTAAEMYADVADLAFVLMFAPDEAFEDLVFEMGFALHYSTRMSISRGMARVFFRDWSEYAMKKLDDGNFCDVDCAERRLLPIIEQIVADSDWQKRQFGVNMLWGDKLRDHYPQVKPWLEKLSADQSDQTSATALAILAKYPGSLEFVKSFLVRGKDAGLVAVHVIDDWLESGAIELDDVI